MKTRAVILLSGGVDSAAALHIARAEGHELYALSFDYGQRHGVELDAAARTASAAGVKEHLVLKVDLGGMGGSALTDDIDVPKGGTSSDEIPVTYVPARNTIFLSFALAWAEVLKAPKIFIGANTSDYSGYPDCRPEYLDAFENMANLALKETVQGRMRVEIAAPLIDMSKADIIRKGTELGVDYSLTWSCYDPQPGRAPGGVYTPCGGCDSCRFRAKGFKEAGIKDPLVEVFLFIRR